MESQQDTNNLTQNIYWISKGTYRRYDDFSYNSETDKWDAKHIPDSFYDFISPKDTIEGGIKFIKYSVHEEALKRIKELEAIIADMQSSCSESANAGFKLIADNIKLAKGLEYYAYGDNWYGQGAPFNEDKHHKFTIASVDTEGTTTWVGGRTARMVLKELGMFDEKRNPIS